jgi:hypothetical protein
MAITVPVRTAEFWAQDAGDDLYKAAVFRELQFCRSRAAGACSVSSPSAVHKKRVRRYEFAKLSSGNVRSSSKPCTGAPPFRRPR